MIDIAQSDMKPLQFGLRQVLNQKGREKGKGRDDRWDGWVSMSLIVKSIGNVPDSQAILIILSEYITLFPRLEVGVLKLVPQAVLLVVRGLGEFQT